MACLTAYIIFSALFVLSAALPASVTASTPTLIIRIPSSARNSSMARATAAAYLPPSWVTAGWVPISTYFLFIFDVLSIVALVAMSLNRFAAEELAFHLIDGAMWLLRYTLRTVSYHHLWDPGDCSR